MDRFFQESPRVHRSGLILLDEQRASAARGAIEFDRAQDLGTS